MLEGGEVRIYSRNSENNTSKYPDIISRMPKVTKSSIMSVYERVASQSTTPPEITSIVQYIASSMQYAD